MANKKVCDRCGKDVGLKTIDLTVFFGPDFLKIDLCEECEEKLHEWLKNKKCKCSKNENVIELLDQLENAEKQICDLKEQVEVLQQKNKALAEEQIKKLLEKCHISFEMRFEDQL